MDLTGIFFIIVIIFSAIIHEYSHGWMADYLGDPTARLSGRLTLNPLAHIDIWGSIVLPLLLYLGSGGSFLFAYAKPVPFNPFNLTKSPRYGPGIVAIAGPLSNLLIAVIFGILYRFLPIYDLMPFFEVIVYANILLAVFNLVPIPPLDGSRILLVLLPSKYQEILIRLEPYGMIIILIFIFFGFQLILPIMQFLLKIIIG